VVAGEAMPITSARPAGSAGSEHADAAGRGDDRVAVVQGDRGHPPTAVPPARCRPPPTAPAAASGDLLGRHRDVSAWLAWSVQPIASAPTAGAVTPSPTALTAGEVAALAGQERRRPAVAGARMLVAGVDAGPDLDLPVRVRRRQARRPGRAVDAAVVEAHCS
jgi:hypothetical protein